MIRSRRSVQKNLVRAGILAILLAAALAPARPAGAAYGVINRKVSGTMIAEGDVGYFAISPESEYIVFTADRFYEGLDELFVVPLYGGVAPRRLSGTMTYGGRISSVYGAFQISQGTRRAVYMADQENLSEVELYSVPLDGGVPVKLNDALPYDGDVQSFTISPNGQWVVYLADQETNDVNDLYSVPIDRSHEPVRLNDDLATFGEVYDDYKISPDSLWVVYRSTQGDAGVFELYRTAINGGTPAKLNTGVLEGRATLDFRITNLGLGVVFENVSESGESEYYSNYIDGTEGVCGTGGPFKLNHDLLADENVYDLELAPNDQRVVYTVRHASTEVRELYSNSICGGSTYWKKLSGDVPVGKRVQDFKISANSLGVAFGLAQVDPFLKDLYAVSISGGARLPLSPALPTGGFVTNYEIVNNDARVAFIADAETLGKRELYSVPSTGLPAAGEPRKISTGFPSDADVAEFQVMPDGFHVLYRIHQDSTNRTDLYTNSTLGGAQIKVNGPLVALGSVTQNYQASPDNKVVVYIADQDEDEKYELYISYLGWQVALPLVTR